MYKTRGSTGPVDDDEVIGSGRFQRKPRATLARIAQAVEKDDARPLTDEEAQDLMAYLSIATHLGGMTFKQMDAFWDLNKQLLRAHAELRDWIKERPVFDNGQVPELEVDITAVRWIMSLESKAFETVAKAAYAQFKDEFPMPDNAEGMEIFAP